MVAKKGSSSPPGSRLSSILAVVLSLQTGLGAMPSLDAKTQASLTSMRATAGTPTVDTTNIANNAKYPNVQRVMGLVPQSKFDEYFPPGVRLPVYTYEGFLQAVAKFPALCDETSTKYTKDVACRRTLATMFAHFRQEVQQLQFVEEIGCSPTTCKDYSIGCDTWPEVPGWYPCLSTNGYYGRGAKQLSYTYNYGPFSWIMFADRTVLLKNPERIATEGYLAFASAAWFTVTPQSPKPSIHEVVTGLWQPNAEDLNAGIKGGFGATINIINGAVECGKPTAQASNRVEYYKYYVQQFGVDISQEQLDCATMKPFPVAGSGGAVLSYWAEDWAVPTPKCTLVNYQTRYPLQMGNVSYELCVCRKSNITEANCQPAIEAIAVMKASTPTPPPTPTISQTSSPSITSLTSTISNTPKPVTPASSTSTIGTTSATNEVEGAPGVTSPGPTLTNNSNSDVPSTAGPTVTANNINVSSGAWRLPQCATLQIGVVAVAHLVAWVFGHP